MQKVTTILFLNKIDLLPKVMVNHPLKAVFPDFKGKDYTAAGKFLVNKFVALKRSRETKLFCHFTHATDSRQLKTILGDIISVMLEKSLRANHLYELHQQ